MRGDGSVRRVNRLFLTMTESGLDALRKACLLSKRQEAVMELYFVRRNDVNFVADTIGISQRTVGREIAVIREKVENALRGQGHV